MIQLIKGENPKLYLTPRSGFRRAHRELELELVYGHTCPACQNVIQAVVKSDKLVDLHPFEETEILVATKDGPEVKKRVRGAYEVSLFKGANPAKGSLMKIRLRNHLILPNFIKNRDNATGLEETGEKPCFKTGFHNLREDLLLKDLYMSFNVSALTLAEYEMPNVEAIFRRGEFHHRLNDFRIIPAVGDSLPVILVDRTMLRNPQNHWLVRQLEPYKRH
jgi:hypothetical protein